MPRAWTVLWICLLALWPIFAVADSIHIELIGGTVATQANGDVVLQLQISPLRLNHIAGTSGAEPATVGDARRRLPALSAALTRDLSLHAGNRDMPPSDVTLPALAGQLDQAPLPSFVPVQVGWRNVGAWHAAFAANLVTAKVSPDGLTQIQLVLNENMPWWQVLSRSILLGFEHIVPAGLDHILFVLGIYLAASRFRDLLWQVTAFTVAHSVTLGLTMGGVLIVGPFWEKFVEIGIAVSIFTVAFENCLLRQSPGWRRILVVGGFGLVHGMGFAGRLAQVKWPAGTFGLSLFGANLGIELGQLTVIAAAALVSAWWWKCSWYQSRVAVPISLLIGLYGMFAALDRLTNLSLPRKEFADTFWSVYDHHFWSIPFTLGLSALLVVWAGYRGASAAYRHYVLPASDFSPKLTKSAGYNSALRRIDR